MIKKEIARAGLASLFFVAFSLIPVNVFAEKISDFNSVITLGKSDGIQITETITYDSEGLSKHGIYRDIPLNTIENSPVKRRSINVLSVTDENGKKVPYEESVSITNGQAIKRNELPRSKLTRYHLFD